MKALAESHTYIETKVEPEGFSGRKKAKVAGQHTKKEDSDGGAEAGEVEEPLSPQEELARENEVRQIRIMRRLGLMQPDPELFSRED